MSQSSPIFFMVAGEQSGDLHGSKLIQSIKKLNPNSTFIGHGGDRMQSCGLEIMHHVNELAIMGFTEVLKHLPFMINVMGESLEKIKEIKPDRIILIDYPGFNLCLAKALYKNNKQDVALRIFNEVANAEPSKENQVEDWDQIIEAKLFLKNLKN